MITFELDTLLMRLSNRKTTINNMVRAIEQLFVLDPVK